MSRTITRESSSIETTTRVIASLRDPSLSPMEEAIFHVSIGIVVFLGLLTGQRRVRSIGGTMLVGVGCTFGVAAALFVLTIAANVIAAGSLDARLMGFRIGALLLFGSAVGAGAALAGAAPSKPCDKPDFRCR
jgi:hypothetical protein